MDRNVFSKFFSTDFFVAGSHFMKIVWNFPKSQLGAKQKGGISGDLTKNSATDSDSVQLALFGISHAWIQFSAALVWYGGASLNEKIVHLRGNQS